MFTKKTFQWTKAYLSENVKKTKSSIRFEGMDYLCARRGHPLAHATHDLWVQCCAIIRAPAPLKLNAPTALHTLWSKTGWLSLPKDRLTGDVLDESSVRALLQRWYPPRVTQVCPIKHFHVSPSKKKEEEKRKREKSCKTLRMKSNTEGFSFHPQALDFISDPQSNSHSFSNWDTWTPIRWIRGEEMKKKY